MYESNESNESVTTYACKTTKIVICTREMATSAALALTYCGECPECHMLAYSSECAQCHSAVVGPPLQDPAIPNHTPPYAVSHKSETTCKNSKSTKI